MLRIANLAKRAGASNCKRERQFRPNIVRTTHILDLGRWSEYPKIEFLFLQ